ncbi:hypothetical protein HRbin19_01699 [bacterium HR19]|nr:hypothetical protein HRbin19_01699 [bacterium HR19]
MHYVLIAIASTIPWIIVRFTQHEHISPYMSALLSGTCIVGAGFLLTWASDSSRKYISGALAIAIVALLAVLPEYSVDMYLSWKAGINEQYTHYAVANMTGANRLLIGLGWSVILFIHFIKTKKREIEFDEKIRNELLILFISTIWSFNIFFKSSISLFDFVFLFALFVFYIYRASQMEIEELEEDFEPVRTIQEMKPSLGIPLIIFMFAWSGFCIFISAEPFAESLIEIGRSLNVSEFLLIQWVAPLASEAPEFIVTIIWAFKERSSDALRALVSSKVNQWTLLISTIPLVFTISKIFHGVGNVLAPLPLDHRQKWEMLLTSAQSLFAFFIIYDLKFSLIEASLLFLLFFSQFVFEQIREEVTFAYLGLSIPFLILKLKRK